MRRHEWASLALLLMMVPVGATAGCGRKQAVAEPPGFADLSPVPSDWGLSDPETLMWRERLKGVYKALGPEAHWKLKKEGKVVFRLRDCPRMQQDTLAEFLRSYRVRDWVESKVGRPPDIGRLTFQFEGAPGSTVTLVILDPVNPGDGGLRCSDIGSWPANQGQK